MSNEQPLLQIAGLKRRTGAPETPADQAVTFEALRNKLAGVDGKTYWRSLEELAETPDFHDYVGREFPEQASEFTDPSGRRQFLKLMGASIALAGVSACTRQPDEKIVPYVRQPEEIVPGRPLFYATAMPNGGYAMPVLVENHMGRPTKIEGNPEHPASLGATDLYGQASVLGLYDPDRSRSVRYRGDIRTWKRLPRGPSVGSERAKADQRPGPPHSHRADLIAIAHRSIRHLDDGDARSEVASVGRGVWRRSGRRAGVHTGLSLRQGRRRRVARRGFSELRSRIGSVFERFRIAPPDRHVARGAQSPVRRRARADDYGRQS